MSHRHWCGWLTGKHGEGEPHHAPAVPYCLALILALILGPRVQRRQGIIQVITPPACFSTAADWLGQPAGAGSEVILGCCQVKAKCQHQRKCTIIYTGICISNIYSIIKWELWKLDKLFFFPCVEGFMLMGYFHFYFEHTRSEKCFSVIENKVSLESMVCKQLYCLGGVA